MLAVTARCALFLIVLASAAATCGAQGLPLSMAAQPGESGVAGRAYRLQLEAKGGTAPYRWRVVTGKLPPGLELNSNSGLISGSPASAGEFRFSIQLSDSGVTGAHVEREFVVVIGSALTVDWKQPPRVQGDSITGQVVVKNHTGNALDLTVIVLAVNNIGKAFALGYQHFNLKSESASPTIPFGSSMPFGDYIVHVDAIGEVASTGAIYRARQQTQTPLVLRQR